MIPRSRGERFARACGAFARARSEAPRLHSEVGDARRVRPVVPRVRADERADEGRAEQHAARDEQEALGVVVVVVPQREQIHLEQRAKARKREEREERARSEQRDSGRDGVRVFIPEARATGGDSDADWIF